MRVWLSAISCCLWFGSVALVEAGQQDELLAPEVAFALTVTAPKPTVAVAEWSIAKGYYLYRERIRAESLTAGVRVDKLESPPGKIKEDEFFGRTEVYRDHVVIRLTLRRDADAPNRVKLKITSQGCADRGVCYPPQHQTLALDLPPPATQPLLAPSNQAGNLLSIGGWRAESELLEGRQAFIATVTAADASTLVANWIIAKGYYLYRNTLQLSLIDANGLRITGLDIPAGIPTEDEFFGSTEVFYDTAKLTAHLQGQWPESQELTVELAYQGCAEIGVCYPPMSERIPIKLMGSDTEAVLQRAQMLGAPRKGLGVEESTSPSEVTGWTASEAEQDRMAQMLIEQRFLALPPFFGFGLLLAFTPCVFPMIPILSSIIVGQGASITHRKAFLLSSVYVLAMAMTYTIAGVLAALLGQNIQAIFQHPWVLVGFSTLFVLLALSMFGFYDLQLPNRWQSRLTELSGRQAGGTYLGVAAMGLLSALIVGPCVAPPLIGILTVIAATGDGLLGGAMLFAMSLGMGIPLLVIGTSAGKLLPRAGHWMDKVKAVFGVLMLAVAIWILERVLPAEISMLLWAVLLIVCATYMGAFRTLTEEISAWHLLIKGMGIVLLVYGILLLVGVAAGGKDTLQPLRGVGLLSSGAASLEKLPFQNVETIADVQQELRQAAGRPVVLDFYADWCVSCKELEKYTFSDPAVQSALGGTVLLKADVTANDEADQALLRHFAIIGPPAILFFGADGTERRSYRVVGFMPAREFEQHVSQALSL